MNIDDYLQRAWTLQEELLHIVNLEIRTVKSQRNVHATIHKLPVELLLYVFRLALPPPEGGHDYIRSRAALLRVCTYWTTMINDAPSLWTVVTSMCGSHHLALTLGELGRTCPLHIHCNFLSDAEFAPILGQISPHIHRWETANIVMPETEEGRQHLSSPAARLRRMYLSAPHGTESGAGANAQPFNIFNGSADWLEEVRIALTGVPWDSPILRGLRSLCLQWCKPIRASDIICILNDSPDLRTLILEETEITADMRADPSKAANMTKLQVICLTAELEGIREVFNGFKAPNCETFSLYLETAEAHDIEGFLHTSLASFFPFVRRIMLQSPKTVLDKSTQDDLYIKSGYGTENKHIVPFSLRSAQTPTHVITAFLRQVLGEDQASDLDVRLIIGRDWGTEGRFILNQVSSCCNVVDLWLGADFTVGGFDTENTLRALAEPTVLPHLQHLIIAGNGWDGDELRAILQKRYSQRNECTPQLRIRLIGRGVNATYNFVKRLEEVPMIEEAFWYQGSSHVDSEDR
ncbi:hypothetical protein FRC01_002269, partial [Tulasnella sp. 417]